MSSNDTAFNVLRGNIYVAVDDMNNTNLSWEERRTAALSAVQLFDEMLIECNRRGERSYGTTIAQIRDDHLANFPEFYNHLRTNPGIQASERINRLRPTIGKTKDRTSFAFVLHLRPIDFAYTG
jgi:hypothetical protein